jgi:hypothetical protein
LFDVASGMQRTVRWYLERAAGSGRVPVTQLAGQQAREAS